MDLQTHIMLLKITIHKIQLSVRFPCSLTFQLKIENKSIDCRGSYELVKGMATPEETLRLEADLQKKDDGTYRDKQAKIVIYMTSANGKIPAGSANLSLGTVRVGSSENVKIPIDKCPDKQANINFTYSLEFLRNAPRLGSHGKTNSYGKLEQSSMSSSSRIRYNSGSPQYDNIRGSANQKYSKFSVQRKSSNNSGTFNNNNYSALNYQIQPRSTTPDRDFFDGDQKRTSRVSGAEQEEDYLTRTLGSQKGKADRPRDNSKIQRESSAARKQFQFQQQSDQHINRVRNQLTQVSNENEMLKEKLRNYERREKQQNQIVKDLKDEVERKKQKNYQQEFIRMESQSILDEKQKLLKQMQAQLKLYEEEISDLKMNMATQNKRIQFKQTSLKDQLTKLNDKYQQSELERQKAIIDLNLMLQQLQNTEKKNQLTIKQKDKVQSEEKNKLLKKTQMLSRTIEQQKDTIDEKLTQISDLQRQIKIMQSKLSDSQTEGSQLNLKSKNLNYELQKERQINKNLGKQIENYQIIEKQLLELRKKYQELELQDQSTKKSLQNAMKLNQSHQNKIKQLQQQIVSKSQQISALMTKSFNLASQIEAYKKQQQNYNREAENLSLNNLSAAKKIEEMRRQLDQLQLAKNELQMQSEQQIAYMIKSKQYLQSELEQAKWNAQKYKDNYEETINKNKSLNTQILELNRRILELDDRSARLQQQIADAKSTIAAYIHQKQLEGIKQKDLQDKLKEKNDEIYELNKKISKMERQNFMLTEKQKHTQKFYTDKLETEQGTSKTKQTKYNQALQNINKLQIELMTKEEKIALLQSTQIKIMNESEYLKDQLKSLKKQNEDKEDSLLSLNQQNLVLTDKLTLTTQNLQKQAIAKTQVIQNLSKKSKEFDDYKAANNAALEQLFQQIAKDINASSGTSQLTLLSFPEASLTPLQVEAMKKRNNIIIKYQQTIRALEINLKNLDEQLNKAKKIHVARQEELEALLENQKSKFKGVQSDLSLEKQQLLQKISDLEDKVFGLTADNQKLNIQNEENRINSNDQQNHIHQLNFEVENYKNQIKILQQNIKNLKEQNIKAKSTFENSLQSTTQQNSVQVDKLRKSIVENEKKINILDRTVTEKEQMIGKLENSLENISHLKQKTEQKLIQMTARLNELALDRKSGIENQKNYERTVKKLEQNILVLEAEIQAINKKVSESQIQKKKLQDILSQQQIMKTKLVGELELANQHCRQLEDLLKNTDDKSKKSSQKNVQQIKKLKEQIISLTSTVELKSFEITQHQATIKLLKSTNQDIGQQSANRREELLNLQSSLEQNKNNYILVAQQFQTALAEKQSLENQLKSAKQALFNLQEMLNENQTNLESMTLKERQIARLKQQISLKDRNYDKTLQDNKMQNAELKKEITSRVQREEDYKKRVRELQSFIQNQRYDIETEKKGWEETADSERKKLLYELEGVKDENKLLAEQFQFQREQMNHQLDQAAEQIAHLKQIIHESQYQIENSSSQNFEQLEKIKALELQLKGCKEQWQRQKLIYVPTQKQLKQIQSEISRYQKYALELQKKNKQLTEVAKKRLAEDQVVSNSDLLRQINTILLRNKSKILSRVGEREREQVIADFKQIHQKLEGAIKSYHLLK